MVWTNLLMRVVLGVAAWLVFGAVGVAAQEVDTIRVGHPALRDMGRVSFPDSIRSAITPIGMDETYSKRSIDTIDGFRISAGERTLSGSKSWTWSRGTVGGLDVLYLTGWNQSGDGSDTTEVEITMRASDCALIRHRLRATRDSAEVAVVAGRVTGWLAPAGKPLSVVDIALDGDVLPSHGLFPWIVGRLPLREGYRAAIASFNMWTGGERWAVIHVTGSEQIDYHGEPVSCWVVDYDGPGPPGYAQTQWIAKSSGRLLKSEARKGPDDPVYTSEGR